MLKVGRTEQGAKAAASHTASLAGADGVYNAVFERYGVYRARTTEEMLDVAYAASRGRFPKGRRLAILTNSGGIGVQAADFAADEALDVPTASDGVQQLLIEISPNGAPFNPIDLTGQVANDPPMYARAIDAVLASGEFDTAYVNVGLIAGLPFIKQPLLDNLRAVAEKYAAVPMIARPLWTTGLTSITRVNRARPTHPTGGHPREKRRAQTAIKRGSGSTVVKMLAISSCIALTNSASCSCRTLVGPAMPNTMRSSPPNCGSCIAIMPPPGVTLS